MSVGKKINGNKSTRVANESQVYSTVHLDSKIRSSAKKTKPQSKFLNLYVDRLFLSKPQPPSQVPRSPGEKGRGLCATRLPASSARPPPSWPLPWLPSQLGGLVDPNLVAVLSTLLFKFHVAKPNGICDFFFVLDISFNEKAKMMKLQDLKKKSL